MSKIKDDELINVAQIYNDEGCKAAYELISNRGIKYPYAVIKRMKNHPRFVYDKDTDSFMHQDKSLSEDVFISMEELCSPVSKVLKTRKIDDRTEAMEKLILDLLGDRLLELSQYITLESSSKTMMIDQTSLKNAGYKIITH